jgi:hypothetical protein
MWKRLYNPSRLPYVADEPDHSSPDRLRGTHSRVSVAKACAEGADARTPPDDPVADSDGGY